MWLDPEHHTPPGLDSLTRARNVGGQDRARNIGGQDRALLRRPPVPSHAMGLCHWEFNPRQPHFPAAAAFMRKNTTICSGRPPGNKTIGVLGEPTINLLITCPAGGGQVQGWLNPRHNKPSVLFPSVPSDGGKPDPLTEATGPSDGGQPVPLRGDVRAL